MKTIMSELREFFVTVNWRALYFMLNRVASCPTPLPAVAEPERDTAQCRSN
jgi:hypothetical protein